MIIAVKELMVVTEMVIVSMIIAVKELMVVTVMVIGTMILAVKEPVSVLSPQLSVGDGGELISKL